MRALSAKAEAHLKRHAKNMNHATLPEIQDFNALRDT
ncbi:hypothetical protein SAMN05443635_109117 [Roseobacter denitrificans OCh 114]|nr:hypothetical protein SAMN05443635_109117 [Roseobacter denitrificans OCh 114]